MKRWRPLTWLLLSIACLLGSLYFWRLGNEIQSKAPGKASSAATVDQPARARATPSVSAGASSTVSWPIQGRPSSTNAATAAAARADRFKYRLTNTTNTLGRLARSRSAILLENALIDTSRPLGLSIPDSLRSQGDPGSYIVQARGLVDDAFRAALKQAGADVVSYIPNNAYLVRASANAAQQLSSNPQTQAVLPYEPYYKLSPAVLASVMQPQAEAPVGMVNVVVFPDATEAALEGLQQMGATVVAQDRSPFGPVLTVEPGAGGVPAMARLPGVQIISMASRRTHANDRTRAFVGVAADSVNQTNYLNLSGTNVLVAVNDSGVDATHPDLTGRVFSAFPGSLVDTDGHGTHVAGTIAGSGFESITVTNAIGSIMPGTTNQFRGMAPAASLYSQPLGLLDFALQEGAARTNALISNNSWNYGNGDYDIFAASYDAATRDALPEVTGSQPVLFVFAAGNDGGGDDNGLGGASETVLSPATAKNVITVGALEQPRGITNDVVVDGATNQPWAEMTGSDDEVAGFSGRGNVGIGFEGDFGRFKPDVVAPGVFLVSTRSQQWDTNAYYNPTNYTFQTFTSQMVTTNLNRYNIFVPPNAVQLIISITNIFSTNVTGLPIYVHLNNFATTNDFHEINRVSLPPDQPLVNGATWFYSIGNPTNVPVQFDVTTELVTTNDNGNYYQVLQQLNDSIGTPGTKGPWYRYETGTSMSAAAVSGVLALLDDYFTNRLNAAPSPALLKAMLINGARSVNTLPGYDYQVNKTVNIEGWGAVNLTNCIPISLPTNAAAAIWSVLTNGPSPVLLYDQDPANALATGDSRTIFVTVDPSAQGDPLRATLVWTDPPGNPVASIKLVNSLALVVTNLDDPANPKVYYGNDIGAGANFVFPAATNTPPAIDLINNVQNVYLAPNLGTNYSITVIGWAVNVNAVTANPTKVAQDYALVVSSDSQSTNAFTVTPQQSGVVSVLTPTVTILTNEFASASSPITGQLLSEQHVGANSPFEGTTTVPLGTNTMWGPNGAITLGVTNQWRFYVITNNNAYTNAAFVTFVPVNLSSSRMGVTNVNDPTNASRAEADIDLYATQDSGLTNLNPVSVANAYKSLGRGGTEFILLTNAVSGIYYVGVKSEDQQSAEYSFLGVFSQMPFGQNGGWAINVPQAIPDGSPALPGVANVIAISANPMTIRRVVVTNFISHQNFGDLQGTLTHDGIFTVLNNHTFGNGAFNQTNIYEDNGENDIPGSQHTDGPGTLTSFIGSPGQGVWMLTEADTALTHTGTESNFLVHLDPEAGNGGTNVLTTQANSFTYLAVNVPPQATNLTIAIYNNTGQLQLYVRRGALPTQTAFDYTQIISPPGGALSISKTTLPPLQPGRYFIGVFNPTLNAQTYDLVWTLNLSFAPIQTVNFTSGGPAPIHDDAVSYSTISVTGKLDNTAIAQAAIAVAIDHPRISDLVLTLISPIGQRLVLMENRGGPNAANLGTVTTVTNFLGSQSSGGPIANTNIITGLPASGVLVINYNFFAEPDTIDVYYNGADIFRPGLTSYSGQFFIPFSGVAGTNITIIMNQNGNSDS
ncbi:MAG: S8 family serine peptidase, partial [Verrucomicrobiota bacterium]